MLHRDDFTIHQLCLTNYFFVLMFYTRRGLKLNSRQQNFLDRNLETIINFSFFNKGREIEGSACLLKPQKVDKI